jgi:hypothetical protein
MNLILDASFGDPTSDRCATTSGVKDIEFLQYIIKTAAKPNSRCAVV